MVEPIVSVIMPVFNGEEYLIEAIDSVVNQTFKDFEFIIINDGSTDNSLKIIESFKEKDSRIRIISRENKGLIFSLNEGIQNSEGQFIARMDADDICLPQRFEKQIKLMKTNNLDICGGHYFIIDEHGKYLDSIITPVEKNAILLNLAENVPFAHGSVMIKKELFKSNKYGDSKYTAVEDYSLWIDLYNRNYKFGNVDDFIFKYRDFQNSFSKTKLKKMNNERKMLSNNFTSEYIVELKESIDITLNKHSLSVWEENYLQLVSYKLRYKCLQVSKKVSKKSLIVGLTKYVFAN